MTQKFNDIYILYMYISMTNRHNHDPEFNRLLMHNKWTDFLSFDQQPGVTLISPLYQQGVVFTFVIFENKVL